MRKRSWGRGSVRRNRGNSPVHRQTRFMNHSGRLPYDLTLDDISSPGSPVTRLQDDDLSAALLKRNTELSPSTEETKTTHDLVTRVQNTLETLILTPGTFEACQVEEVRQVGSFRQGTILAGHKSADFVVVLKILPTLEAIGGLNDKVTKDLRETECVRSTVTNRGFDISNLQATVRVFITTVPQDIRKLDPKTHLASKLIREHWDVIRHSRWFEENVHSSTTKVLIRILRDLRRRYPEFLCLSTWMLDLLAHFCVMNNPTGQALPINAAFRRTLSLMSCGMYLPGYAGTGMRGHKLTYEQQDMVTGLAQTLLRILSHGGYKIILGLETMAADLMNSIPTIWGDGVVTVVVLPLKKVYEKPAIGEVEELEDNVCSEEEEETLSQIEIDSSQFS